MVAALYKEQLGEQIADRRRELGLTQAELAERAHVRESTTVSRWERGERAPNDLEAVAKALETTASEMLAQLAPIHQKDRKRLDPGGQSQLDRIEGKLDELLALALEQELEQAAGQDERPAAGTAASARGSRKTRRA